MALMSDIIGKYQREANEKIADARKGSPEKIQNRKDLLDSIVINKGCGTEIAPAHPDVGKGSIFKAVSNSEIKQYVKQYNSQGSNGGISQPQASTPQQKLSQNTVIISSGAQREQEDIFKKVSRLEDENRKLKEQLEQLKKQ